LKARMILAATLLISLAQSSFAPAEPIKVRRVDGARRGFLNIRSQTGALLGYGEYVEFVTGDRITARQTLHFRDGSLDDETTVFTQKTDFQFVSDHHIQKGPFFKTATDATLEANGNYTLKSTDKDGKEKTETNHFDLPPDISNGMVGTLLPNFPNDIDEVSLGQVVPSGKGRLIKLKITPDGKQSFSITPGVRRTANLYRVKLDLGGVAGVVAPIVGKQPTDLQLWLLPGDVPLLLREVGQLSEGGPIVSLELAGTSYK
jgi:hypothetical protein